MKDILLAYFGRTPMVSWSPFPIDRALYVQNILTEVELEELINLLQSVKEDLHRLGSPEQLLAQVCVDEARLAISQAELIRTERIKDISGIGPGLLLLEPIEKEYQGIVAIDGTDNPVNLKRSIERQIQKKVRVVAFLQSEEFMYDPPWLRFLLRPYEILTSDRLYHREVITLFDRLLLKKQEDILPLEFS